MPRGVKEAGELNLQFRKQALKAGKSGKIAIVPGKPEENEFYKRMIHHHEDERMPKDAAPLTTDQIDLVKRWIEAGANWADHWAYQNPTGSGKSVDEMVSAKLKKENLSFSPEASLRTLARRISFDVAGLPPSPERVEALEKEATTDKESALRGYLDELLASPSYGEKWAVPWLDLARYADSNGYEKDSFRDMWP